MKCLLILLIAATSAAFPQVDTGAISGLIRDASGGGIPAVRVKITDESTGLATELSTNPTGLYVSPPLQPGAKRVKLDVSQRFEVDFDLVVGAVSSSVGVKDIANELQTESTTLSNLRSEQAVKDLRAESLISVIRRSSTIRLPASGAQGRERSAPRERR